MSNAWPPEALDKIERLQVRVAELEILLARIRQTRPLLGEQAWTDLRLVTTVAPDLIKVFVDCDIAHDQLDAFDDAVTRLGALVLYGGPVTE